MKILILEDVIDIAQIVEKFIHNKLKFLDNLQIDVGYNGEEGIQFCQKNYYDLILTDIDMPIKKGDEFLKELKEKKISHGKVYIMTGNYKNSEMDSLCDYFIEKGTQDFLEIGTKIKNDFNL